MGGLSALAPRTQPANLRLNFINHPKIHDLLPVIPLARIDDEDFAAIVFLKLFMRCFKHVCLFMYFTPSLISHGFYLKADALIPYLNVKIDIVHPNPFVGRRANIQSQGMLKHAVNSPDLSDIALKCSIEYKRLQVFYAIFNSYLIDFLVDDFCNFNV